MQNYLVVFLGAGIGGSLRYAVNSVCARYCGPSFPWGTLAVNLAGSFLMGALAGWLAFKAGEGWSHPLRLCSHNGNPRRLHERFGLFPRCGGFVGTGRRRVLRWRMWRLPSFCRSAGLPPAWCSPEADRLVTRRNFGLPPASLIAACPTLCYRSRMTQNGSERGGARGTKGRSGDAAGLPLARR